MLSFVLQKLGLLEPLVDIMATIKTSLFTRIHSGTERCKFLVIQETHKSPCLLLLKSLIRKTIQNSSLRVYVLSLDTDAAEFTDLKGIKSIAPLASQGPVEFKDFLQTFVKNDLDATKANRVFIRSINPLLILYSLKEVHDILTQLLSAVESLTVGVNQEVLSEKESVFLSRLSTTSLVFHSGPSSNPNEVSLKIRHKKKHSRLGLKIEEKTESIRMICERSFEVVKSPVPNQTTSGDNTDVTESELKGLTFNLQLSDKQKSAKDQVQLPYIK